MSTQYIVLRGCGDQPQTLDLQTHVSVEGLKDYGLLIGIGKVNVYVHVNVEH